MRLGKHKFGLTAALCFALAATASYAGGKHGPREGGPGGPGGHGGPRGGGPGGSPLIMFDTLDLLESTTPPSNFTVENFPAADTDSNGTLDADEWTAFADAKHDKLVEGLLKRNPDADADSNGELDDSEIAAIKASMIEKMSAMLLEKHPEADTDSNGEISSEEFEAVQADHRAKFLEREPDADLDGDGTLTAAEMAAFLLAKQPGEGHDGGPGGPGGPGHMRGRPGGGHGRG